ncbi:MAG: glycosyltransferase [Cytophagales bacterium]|nr:glycosyltransferase [Cytophagales bacterium]
MQIQTNFYLERFGFREQAIMTKPVDDLGIVVVIPSYKEPNLLTSLRTLYVCDIPSCGVEVIVVINCSEKAPQEIKEETLATFEETKEWAKTHSDKIQFHVLLENELPKKHAGVGLARKIGMDEAIRRFEWIGNHKGIVVCFDADSLCETNYLVAIQSHFEKYPKATACALHFEHPIEGEDDEWIYEGIINYELHLRYYVDILRYANFPNAYQTIGSSMAVRSETYQKLGGMNRRKAGEDFYFLHKIIPLGNFTELKETKVIPSPRVSDRVPFGTGKAIGDFMNQEDRNQYLTYNVQSFLDLKPLCDAVPNLYEMNKDALKAFLTTLPQSIQTYLTNMDFVLEVPKIQKQSNTQKTFENRFFLWFNGLVVLKYVHYARDEYYPNQTIEEACEHLCTILNLPIKASKREMLQDLRKFDLAQ